MNFRQRVAWLLLFVYLIGTFVLVYYVFEISERYGAYSYEHVVQYHNKDNISSGKSIAWEHLADVPFIVWVVLASIIHFHCFFFLYMCTKSQPYAQLRACVLPVVGFFCICCARRSSQTSPMLKNWKDAEIESKIWAFKLHP